MEPVAAELDDLGRARHGQTVQHLAAPTIEQVENVRLRGESVAEHDEIPGHDERAGIGDGYLDDTSTRARSVGLTSDAGPAKPGFASTVTSSAAEAVTAAVMVREQSRTPIVLTPGRYGSHVGLDSPAT